MYHGQVACVVEPVSAGRGLSPTGSSRR